jgi:hypothetical protein
MYCRLVVCIEMSSCPFEFCEDGIVIGYGASIIKNEAIVGCVVVRHVDHFCATKLLLQFVHEFSLGNSGGTCLLRLWHS